MKGWDERCVVIAAIPPLIRAIFKEKKMKGEFKASILGALNGKEARNKTSSTPILFATR